MRAAIYTRLSRNRQGEHEATLEYQERRGREVAESEGWEILEVLSDSDLSGASTDKRTGYIRLRNLIGAGALDVVIVQDTDRLNREVREGVAFFELCAEHDVRVRTWHGFEVGTGTATGKLTTTMNAAVAAYYSDVVGEKVKAAHQRRLAAGKTTGKRMYGDIPSEARIVRQAANMALSGQSVRSIARWLNGQDIKTTRDNDWTTTALRGLLTNPRLAGILTYKGEEVGIIADKTPVLDRDTFERLRVAVSRPGQRKKPGRPTHLLTTLMHCIACGGRMRVGSNNKGRRYYRCDGDRPCDRRMTITASRVDDIVTSQALERLESLNLDERVGRHLGSQEIGVAAELADIERRQTEVAEAYAEGSVTFAQLTTITQRLKERESEVRAAIQPATQLPSGDLVRQAWEGLDFDGKKSLLQAMIHRIDVQPSTLKSRRHFDPKRLLISWIDLEQG